MPSLKKIRQINDYNEKVQEEKKQTYNSPSEIAFVTKIIKEQNRQLLEQISIIKRLKKKEKQLLFDKYWKVNYYTPSTTHPSYVFK